MTDRGRGGSPIRVQKYLSQAGAASRRQAEALIAEGRISINGETVTELGVKVTPGVDTVSLDGSPVTPAVERWIVFHKAVGTLCTRTDPHGGETVYDVLPDWASGLRYVGRLDRDTSGLLLLTNDGDLGAALAHPSGRVEREYRATVQGKITASALRSLKQGIELDDGFARPKRVRRLSATDTKSEVLIVLTEGRKREVRRLMKAVRHPVVSLERVRFGPFQLGGLSPGNWRAASARELEEARQWVERRKHRRTRRAKTKR